MPSFREIKQKRRRDRIYAAALALLSEKGFNDTHMRDISERAELAVGTLYNYYGSKSELYMEIMEEKWREITNSHTRRIIRLVCNGDDLFSVIKEILWPIFGEMFAINMDDWGELFMAMFSSKKYMARGASLDLQTIEVLSVLLAKLQKRGLVRKTVAPVTASTSIYSIVAFNVLAFLFIEGMDKDYFFHSTEQQLRLMVDGLGADPGKEDSQ
jgi:AcrR family transcriptional regulator